MLKLLSSQHCCLALLLMIPVLSNGVLPLNDNIEYRPIPSHMASVQDSILPL